QAAETIATVELACKLQLGELAGSAEGSELRYVDFNTIAGEHHTVWIGHERIGRDDRIERRSDRHEALAQAPPSLLTSASAPKQFGQVFTGNRSPRAYCKVAQQRLCLLRQTCDSAVAAA